MPTTCNVFLFCLDKIRHVLMYIVLSPACLFSFTDILNLIDATHYELNENKIA